MLYLTLLVGHVSKAIIITASLFFFSAPRGSPIIISNPVRDTNNESLIQFDFKVSE